MFENLLWKAKRLRAMDAREVAYRFRQVAQTRFERLGWGRAKAGRVAGKTGRLWCAEVANEFDATRYRNAADRILAGNFDIFALKGAPLGFPPDWNRDPKTGTQAPLVFGKSLDYRAEHLVGDIKYLWEPNRHLQLVTLAQAWRLTGEKRYAVGCQTLLDSWFDQCPYPLGVNWVSSLEHSVRLLNWSFAWQLLGGDESPIFIGESGSAFKARWHRVIYQHCHFIAGHYSRYSSANNHLLGEYMGLFVATLTWPLWPESSVWQSVAFEGFQREALVQNGVDGVNKEQAIYYQHEVMDMMLLCALIGRANNVEFSAAYWQRLECMMDFVATVTDMAGNVPMIGDADDALMVKLSQELDWSHYRSLLACGAVLFTRSDFANKAGGFDDKARWLLGDAAAGHFNKLRTNVGEQPKTQFPDAGYYLLGARYGAVDEIRAVVDCGGLGYLSIAAHGHADALAMVLSAGGRELLIDPGTYAYHTQKKWRNYFRGTFAHNALRVDGKDQSEIGGNFLWLRKAQAHCELADLTGAIQKFKGWHDGYLCLKDPVTHRREIDFNAETNVFDVVDTLSCSGMHDVELCWHFSELCSVSLSAAGVAAQTGVVKLTMTMDSDLLKPSLLSGQDEPPAGWVSRSFDVKVPTPTVVWRGEIRGNTRLHTKLMITFDQ